MIFENFLVSMFGLDSPSSAIEHVISSSPIFVTLGNWKMICRYISHTHSNNNADLDLFFHGHTAPYVLHSDYHPFKQSLYTINFLYSK